MRSVTGHPYTSKAITTTYRKSESAAAGTTCCKSESAAGTTCCKSESAAEGTTPCTYSTSSSQ